MAEPILSIRDFCVDYITERGPVRALDSLTLDVMPGEILGVAGESGSGKSTMAQALMRILPPPAVISRGSVKLEGRELLTMSEGELRQIRWRRIAMVFQSAMDALNPVIPIGEQIIDTLRAHTDTNSRAARDRAAELLTMVGIPTSQLDAYAHQLSGGMRQRVGIALALALKPAVVILDEPTTALDVIVEREILEQIRMLQQKLGFAVIFITHDLGRMLQFSDRVAIFYAARMVEVGPAAAMATASKHPYTQGLLRATPSIRDAGEGYASIPGSPPSLASPPSGCRFHPRCAIAMDVCKGERPPYVTMGPGHIAACYAVDNATSGK